MKKCGRFNFAHLSKIWKQICAYAYTKYVKFTFCGGRKKVGYITGLVPLYLEHKVGQRAWKSNVENVIFGFV